MEDISLHKLYGGTKIISKVMEVSRRSWIIGESNGTLWSLVEDKEAHTVNSL
jgi:hypothetical protein